MALMTLLLASNAIKLRGHDGVEHAAEIVPDLSANGAAAAAPAEADKDAAVDKSQEAAPAADTIGAAEGKPNDERVDNIGEDERKAAAAAEPAHAEQAAEEPKEAGKGKGESRKSSNHPQDYVPKTDDLDASTADATQTYAPAPAPAPVDGDEDAEGPKVTVDETQLQPKDDGSNDAPLSELNNGPRVVKPAVSPAEAKEKKCPQGFSYTSGTECGPEKWASLRPQWSDCANTGMQSPINVVRTEADATQDLLPLSVHYHAFESRVINNGHSIVVEPTMHHSAEYDQLLEDYKTSNPLMFEQLKASKAGHVEMYGKKFVLRQFHFHAASEHTFEPLLETKSQEPQPGKPEEAESAEVETDGETEGKGGDAAVAAPEQQQQAEAPAAAADSDAEMNEDIRLVKATAATALLQTGSAAAEASAGEDKPIEDQVAGTLDGAPTEVHDNAAADQEAAGTKEDSKDDASAAAPAAAGGERNNKDKAATKTVQKNILTPEEKEIAQADADEEKAKRLREQVVASEEDRLADVPEATKKKIPTPAGHFDLEMHLIHEAEDGQVLIVAVFFKAVQTRSSEFLAKFWSRLPSHPVYNAQQVDEIGVAMDASEALPTSRSYYTYEGSLSAPPCKFQWGETAAAEGSGVLYFLMKEPVYMSVEQLNHFHQFYNGNFRPVQDLGGRKLFLYDEDAALAKYADKVKNGPTAGEVTHHKVVPPTQIEPPQGAIKVGQADTPHVVTNSKDGKKVIIERTVDQRDVGEQQVQSPEGPGGKLSAKQRAANDLAARTTNTVLPAPDAPANTPPITGDTLHESKVAAVAATKGAEEAPKAQGPAAEATQSSNQAAQEAQDSAAKDASAATNQ